MKTWQVEFAFRFADGQGLVIERVVRAPTQESADTLARGLLAGLTIAVPTGRIVEAKTIVTRRHP